MTSDRLVLIAVRLQELGVSHAGTVELLSQYPPDLIEKQLEWLPLRKAKRPEAFIIEAVRNNYSPPKEAFHAQTQKPAAEPQAFLDETAQPFGGSAPAQPEGYGVEGASSDSSPDGRLEQNGSDYDLVLPSTQEENRQT
jgi:hypothetical protein